MVKTLGYASDLGANIRGSSQGPATLQGSALLSPYLEWLDIIQPQQIAQRNKAALSGITALNQQLANQIKLLVAAKQRFLVLGGDHSSAMGTWSGAATALQSQGHLGLIWFDAHMDSHTWKSSHTGNIHGMPLASLLGQGAAELTKMCSPYPKLLPQHVCLIGVRSFETEELALLKKLNVKIYYIEEVQQRGLITVFRDALTQVEFGTAGFGISFDVDVMDPVAVPAVSTPENHGLNVKDTLAALKLCHNNKNFIGIEIAEFNPLYDQQQRTEKFIAAMIQNIFDLGK